MHRAAAVYWLMMIAVPGGHGHFHELGPGSYAYETQHDCAADIAAFRAFSRALWGGVPDGLVLRCERHTGRLPAGVTWAE
jgi:hypothetical protein